MGRYYNGDINGKFWFGVQDSDDAEQFGAEAQEIGRVGYYSSNIEACKGQLMNIFAKLKTEPRFEFEHESDIESFVGALPEAPNELLASLELGLKMHRIIKMQGHVYFEADL